MVVARHWALWNKNICCMCELSLVQTSYPFLLWNDENWNIKHMANGKWKQKTHSNIHIYT